MINQWSEIEFAKTIFGQKLYNFIVKLKVFVPEYICSRHLTCSTLLWSYLILCFNSKMCAYPILIMCQYITDVLDGTIGRERKEGYIKWGYFTDHLLDYVFLNSLFIGLYHHFNDITALYICFPLSLLMISFALETACNSEAYLPFIAITSFWNISLDEIRILLMIYCCLVFHCRKWLKIGFILISCVSILNAYKIQSKLTKFDQLFSDV